MDPITLILTALMTGAAEGLASETVKNAYRGLKSLIENRFKNRPANKVSVLNSFEENPKDWETPLKTALIDIEANKDDEIIKAAQFILSLTRPQQTAAGEFNIQILGDVHGLIQGNSGQVTINFGVDSSKKE